MHFATSKLPATINNERAFTLDIVEFAGSCKPQAKLYEEYISPLPKACQVPIICNKSKFPPLYLSVFTFLHSRFHENKRA
jgi:hypothetical protein